MRILRDPAFAGPCVLVLGMFDGVHRGHQALLMEGAALAEANDLPLVVCTFEPHPMEVLAPGHAPKRLTTLTERAQLMASFGVDDLCVHTFNRALANQTPEAFLERIVQVYEPRYVVCGFNFTFGREGRGNGSLLCSYGAAHGFKTCVIPAVMMDGAPVSSTRVRKALEAGDIGAVSRMLGHAWTLAGRVEGGKHLGRTLGFPTANLHVSPKKALPAFGVYDCYLTLEDGESFRAVVNVGRHPTLPDGPVTVEAFVLDERLNLYGENARLTFMAFRRPEKAFDSVEALKAQITADAEDARAYFKRLEAF